MRTLQSIMEMESEEFVAQNVKVRWRRVNVTSVCATTLNVKVRWRRVNVTSGCATTVCITGCLHFDRIPHLVMRRIEDCAHVGVQILYRNMPCNKMMSIF